MCPSAEDGTGETVLTDFRFGSLVTVDTGWIGLVMLPKTQFPDSVQAYFGAL